MSGCRIELQELPRSDSLLYRMADSYDLGGVDLTGRVVCRSMTDLDIQTHVAKGETMHTRFSVSGLQVQ